MSLGAGVKVGVCVAVCRCVWGSVCVGRGLPIYGSPPPHVPEVSPLSSVSSLSQYICMCMEYVIDRVFGNEIGLVWFVHFVQNPSIPIKVYNYVQM